MIDFKAINHSLLPQARTLLPQWLPGGTQKGAEYTAASINGGKGRSFSVNVNTGKWGEFGDGGDDLKGGDLISLFAAIQNISQGEAAKQLSPHFETYQKTRNDCIHPAHGKPSKIWDYKDGDGNVIGHVARYDLPEEVPGKKNKQYVPFTLNKAGKWQMKQFAEPRPLYGLEELAKRPGVGVVVTEGEKACDSGRILIPNRVVVAWPGGSKAWHKVDWSPLFGWDVVLWADADSTGVKAMGDVGLQRLFANCSAVWVLIPESDRPPGWDAADALAAGWTLEQVSTWAKTRIQKIEPPKVIAPAAVRPNGHAVKPNGHAEPETNTVASPNLVAPKVNPPSKGGMWLAWGLSCGDRGVPIANLHNASLVLEHDVTLRDTIYFDMFLGKIMTKQPDQKAREWEDADDIHLQRYMQFMIGLEKIGIEVVANAVKLIALSNPRNCVVDWLQPLVWDGENRLDHFFEDYFGADANLYTRAVSKNFWISIVARAYKPGCKCDHMVVLEGSQGTGKSSALQAIGGPWFAEQHESATNSKSFAEILQGKLIVEIAELDAFSRADITRVKQVITCCSDRFRPAYGRYAKDHDRQGVFVGTTNKDDWNKDETGARRFWPIASRGEIDIDAIRANREQLFAEAVHRFKAGETWWEMPPAETDAEQRLRYDADPWLKAIAEFVSTRNSVTTNEILLDCIKFELSKVGRSDQMRVATCLRVLHWEPAGNARVGKKVMKVWQPKPE